MGIPRGVGRLLLDEARERPFAGSLLLLSRMTVYFTLGELRAWAKAQGVTLAEVAPRPSHVPNLAAIGCIDDHTLFRALGFSRVESLDFSSWEGADYIADLNRPLPAELHGRFDAVFEAGTIQHVFHLPQVLANIHALLKPKAAGRSTAWRPRRTTWTTASTCFRRPSSTTSTAKTAGAIDAAFFYEFAPYWHRHRFDSAPWKIYRYEPGCLDELAYGGMGAAQLALFFAVTKKTAPAATQFPSRATSAASGRRRRWSRKRSRSTRPRCRGPCSKAPAGGRSTIPCGSPSACANGCAAGCPASCLRSTHGTELRLRLLGARASRPHLRLAPLRKERARRPRTQ